jgi:hypothetical protein
MDYAGPEIPHIKRMPRRPAVAPVRCVRSEAESTDGIGRHRSTEVCKAGVGGYEVHAKEVVDITNRTVDVINAKLDNPRVCQQTSNESDPDGPK